ncbi:hydantoinase/oxoprolinase N-terminal domain-containing protein [Methanohalophilus portucalensis]|uniref:Hydantoinase/oxoprolinase n=2 Tax=Methanohalophilus portucalensis TaxID=39664 RepID=A0A1L9C2J8_9EURY|nr:hydantoinase/oxoprolinase family protein [Methanohalophilus portucalensis]ATU08130.1 hydantoinase [Methanohalophilus portucalensis]OJH48723.1 hydantoinase/oxoprolinase [Methanohalophilus portucalensis FDF-1]RNI10108.1 hydantoinase/oxoprolinase family protein [Methanohalophilus portucalensis FDF-1]SMH43959.1 N-methylhydantoinase A/oxoprolinase/acetone carboxylase, beta subunit [Methanohalophilus portucalensis FDF-1]
MKYSLGIDAGGTYTDAVILRDSDGKIIDHGKARTTYPDLLDGIQEVLDGLDQSFLEKVSLVSVSTTLATNTILEGTGYPVALIMIGEEVPNDSSIKYSISVQGGHSSGGNEKYPLDLDSIKEFVGEVQDKVSAFAVSSYFSVRNPDHELKAREVIDEMTGLPVICGHELSQSLGAYERGVTAYLNAQLLPISTRFMETVASEIDRRGIDAKLMMLKCDGSIVGMKEALKHPIESIFTGPAASLVGASYLAKSKDCLVIDVGGTSTDVAMVIDNLPEITDEGATVGGWPTKVEAIRMETSAMGGDSHVWVKNHNVFIGPRRVVPLCVAASKYPEITTKLKKGQSILKSQLGENIQPTKFFIRTKQEPIELTEREEDLLSRIKDEPLTVSDIYWDSKALPSPMIMASLIQKRLVQAIGFTPTDALHVLGEYDEWDSEASRVGAEILGYFADLDADEIAGKVKDEVAKNMAQNLLSYVFNDLEDSQINKVVRGNHYGGFHVDVPVVLLGGPVQAYVNDMQKLVDAEIILPEYAEVGNAVGALAGKGIKRIEVLIRPNFGESKYNLRPSSVSLFYPGGNETFKSHEEAVQAAREIGHRLIMEYMHEAELDEGEITIDVDRKDVQVHGVGIPMETRFTFLGVGDIKMEKKDIRI